MKRISQDVKLTIQVITAVILVLAGIVMLFLGFYTAPPGEIHDSVLIAYGEVSTFAGSLLGLDYHYRFKTYSLDEERKRNIDEVKEDGE